MEPPTMAAWNLALRLGLEIAALVGLGLAGWQLGTGALQWLAAIALPVLAAVAWGTFNVPGDPSRSGRASVAVPGWLRLLLEVGVLAGGGAGLMVAAGPWWGAAFVVLVLVQYLTAMPRIRWLLTG